MENKYRKINIWVFFLLDEVTVVFLCTNNKHLFLHNELVHLERGGHIVPPWITVAQKVDLSRIS